MMRRKANLLLSVAATALAVSGCSPFHTKLHRPVTHEVADPVAIAQAGEPARSRFQLPSLSLPHQTATKPKVDNDTIRQVTAVARLAERRDDDEQAERAYRKIISVVPQNPLPYHRLGIIKAKHSLFDEAEQLLSKAYELNPTDAKLLSDIGYFYYLTSDAQKAEEFYRYALRFDPNHKACCNNLGILLGEQGRYEDAKSLFRRGCANPGDVESNMAFVYAQRGELSLAVDAYSRALNIDNTLKPAAHGLLNLARMQERMSSANAGPVNSDVETESFQPFPTQVSATAPQRTAPTPARQQTGTTTNTARNRTAAAAQVAVETPQPNQPPRKGLLASLSDFAESVRSPSDEQPAKDILPPASDERVALQPTESADEVTASQDHESLRQMAVRALFTAPGEDAGEPEPAQSLAQSESADRTDETAQGESTNQDGSSSTKVTATPPEPLYAAAEQAATAAKEKVATPNETAKPFRSFLAPKSTRMQQRLIALRAEENQSAVTPATTLTDQPSTLPEVPTATKTALTPPSATAVSVRISDLSDEPAAAQEQPAKDTNAEPRRSSRRRVTPASYDPSNQEVKPGEIRRMFSATTAEHREVSKASSEPLEAAGTAPNESEAVQDYLDTWMDLKTPQAVTPADSLRSSRRVKP